MSEQEKRMPTNEAVAALDAISGDDPDRAHGTADNILQDVVPAEVSAAYDRLIGRSRWWGTA